MVRSMFARTAAHVVYPSQWLRAGLVHWCTQVLPRVYVITSAPPAEIPLGFQLCPWWPVFSRVFALCIAITVS